MFRPGSGVRKQLLEEQPATQGGHPLMPGVQGCTPSSLCQPPRVSHSKAALPCQQLHGLPVVTYWEKMLTASCDSRPGRLKGLSIPPRVRRSKAAVGRAASHPGWASANYGLAGVHAQQLVPRRHGNAMRTHSPLATTCRDSLARREEGPDHDVGTCRPPDHRGSRPSASNCRALRAAPIHSGHTWTVDSSYGSRRAARSFLEVLSPRLLAPPGPRRDTRRSPPCCRTETSPTPSSPWQSCSRESRP